MQHEYEQNRERGAESGRSDRRGADEDRERRFGASERDQNFGRQGQDPGDRGRPSGREQGRRARGYQAGEQYLGSRWEGRGRERDFGASSPYGEEQEWVRAREQGDDSGVRRDRDYPRRGDDYRDYGYGEGRGGGRAGYAYEGSAAYEARESDSDYDFEGRGGYEDRGYGSAVYEGGGAGGYGGRGDYESRDWGGRSQDRSSSELRTREDERQRGGGRSFRGTGPKGYSRSDESILEDVCQRLEDADMDPSDITVTVNGGEIKLSGGVDDRWAKRYAEDVAYEVRGVNDVRNELRVQSGQGQAQAANPEQDEGARPTNRGNGAETQSMSS